MGRSSGAYRVWAAAVAISALGCAADPPSPFDEAAAETGLEG